MVQLKERENICSMLRDTLKILIKNGLTYKRKFNVEGLLGITVDDGEDVFLVSVNELVRSEFQTNQSLQLEVESIEDQQSPSMRDSPQDRGRRKRQKRRKDRGTYSISSDDESHDPLQPGEVSTTGEAIPPRKISKPSPDNKSNPSMLKDITIKKEVDEETWLEENQDNSSCGDQSLVDSSQGVSDIYDRSLNDPMPGPSGSQDEIYDTYTLKQNKMRLSPADYARVYRILKRNDPEFRRKNAERSRKYRQNLSEDKKARNRETARIRQKRYLERLRNKNNDYDVGQIVDGSYLYEGNIDESVNASEYTLVNVKSEPPETS